MVKGFSNAHANKSAPQNNAYVQKISYFVTFNATHKCCVLKIKLTTM